MHHMTCIILTILRAQFRHLKYIYNLASLHPRSRVFHPSPPSSNCPSPPPPLPGSLPAAESRGGGPFGPGSCASRSRSACVTAYVSLHAFPWLTRALFRSCVTVCVPVCLLLDTGMFPPFGSGEEGCSQRVLPCVCWSLCNSGDVPRSGIVGLAGRCLLNFLRTNQLFTFKTAFLKRLVLC